MATKQTYVEDSKKTTSTKTKTTTQPKTATVGGREVNTNTSIIKSNITPTQSKTLGSSTKPSTPAVRSTTTKTTNPTVGGREITQKNAPIINKPAQATPSTTFQLNKPVQETKPNVNYKNDYTQNDVNRLSDDYQKTLMESPFVNPDVEYKGQSYQEFDQQLKNKASELNVARTKVALNKEEADANKTGDLTINDVVENVNGKTQLINYTDQIASKEEENNALKAELKELENQVTNQPLNKIGAINTSNIGTRMKELRDLISANDAELAELNRRSQYQNAVYGQWAYEDAVKNKDLDTLEALRGQYESYDDSFVERRLNNIGKTAVDVVGTVASVAEIALDLGGEVIADTWAKGAEEMKNNGTISDEQFNKMMESVKPLMDFDATNDSLIGTQLRNLSNQLAYDINNGVDTSTLKGKIESFIGQGLDSTVNFLAQYMLFGEAGSLALMSGQSGSQKYFENLEKGYDQGTAFANALATGMTSYFVEKIGMDNFVSILNGTAGQSIFAQAQNAIISGKSPLSFWANAVMSQGIAEGLEEGVEGTIDFYIDNLTASMASGEPVEYNAGDIFYGMMVGAFSGALMGATAGATYKIALNTRKQYNALKTDVDSLVEARAEAIRKGQSTEEVDRALLVGREALANFEASSQTMGVELAEDQVAPNLDSQGTKELLTDDVTPNVEDDVTTQMETQALINNVMETAQTVLQTKGINMDVNEYVDLTPEARTNVSQVQEYANRLRANVGFSSKINGDGYFDPDTGMIMINPNSKLGELSTLVHELTHGTESSGRYYEDLAELVKDSFDGDYEKALKIIKSEYRKNGVNLKTRDQVEREFTAINTQDMLGSQEFVDRLVRYNESLAYRIFSDVRNMFSSDIKTNIENAFMQAFRNSSQTLNAGLQYSKAFTIKDLNGEPVDNFGDPVNKNMAKRLEGTKLTDGEGHPVRLFHTSPALFEEFDPTGSEYYRFGDKIVNYYSTDPVVSGSYTNGRYEQITNGEYFEKQKEKQSLLEELTNQLDDKRAEWDDAIEEIDGRMREALNEDNTTDSIIEIRNNILNNLDLFNAESDPLLQKAPIKVSQSLAQELLDSVSRSANTILGPYNPASKISELEYLYDVRNGKEVFGEGISVSQKVKDLLAPIDKIDIGRYSELNEEYKNKTRKFSDEVDALWDQIDAVKDGMDNGYGKQYVGYGKAINPYILNSQYDNTSWNTINNSDYRLSLNRYEQLAREIVSVFDKNVDLDYEDFADTINTKNRVNRTILKNVSDDAKEYFIQNPIALANFTDVVLEAIRDNDRYSDFVKALKVYAHPENAVYGMLVEDQDIEGEGDDVPRYLFDDPIETNDVVKAVLAINDFIDNKYDGVVFKNITDSASFMADGIRSDIIALFEPNQFKLIGNENPTDDPRMAYSKSLTPEQLKADTDYMKAVDDGDTKKAKRLVERTARENGYTVDVYHGTYNFGRTKFNAYGGALFLTDDPGVANNFSGGQPVRDIAGNFDVKTAPIEDVIKWVEGNTYAHGFRKATSKDFAKEEKLYKPDKSLLRYGQDIYDHAVRASEKFKEIKEDFESGTPYYYMPYNSIAGVREIPNLTVFPESRIREFAEEYHSDGRRPTGGGVYQMYLRPENMLEIEAGGNYYTDVPIPKELRKYAVSEELERGYATSDQILRMASDAGYGTIKYANMREGGDWGNAGVSNVYVSLDAPRNVKSADTVVYDDDGNVIPLSERFNPENEDIRYSESLTPEDLKNDPKVKRYYATIAPYLDTRLNNTNREDLISRAEKAYDGMAKEIADKLGITPAPKRENIGGFENEANEKLRELSWTYDLGEIDSEKARLFTSLMGDLAFENQEAVICMRYLEEGEGEHEIGEQGEDGGTYGFEYGLKYKDLATVEKSLQKAEIYNYNIARDSNYLTVQDFGFDPELPNKIITLLEEDNYESAEERPIYSYYLQREDRQSLYRQRLNSEEGVREGNESNLSGRIEEANERVTDVIDKKAGGQESPFLRRPEAQKADSLTDDDLNIDEKDLKNYKTISSYNDRQHRTKDVDTKTGVVKPAGIIDLETTIGKTTHEEEIRDAEEFAGTVAQRLDAGQDVKKAIRRLKDNPLKNGVVRAYYVAQVLSDRGMYDEMYDLAQWARDVENYGGKLIESTKILYDLKSNFSRAVYLAKVEQNMADEYSKYKNKTNVEEIIHDVFKKYGEDVINSNTVREFRAGLSHITREVRRLMPKTLFDRLKQFRLWAMLSGAKSPVGNFISNSATLGLYKLKGINQAILESALKDVTIKNVDGNKTYNINKEERNATFGKNRETSKYNRKIAEQEWQTLKKEIKSKYDLGTEDIPEIIKNNLKIDRKNKFQKSIDMVADVAQGIQNALLNDAPFARVAFLSKFDELAQARGIDLKTIDKNSNTYDKLVEDAYKYAEEVVSHDETAISRTLANITRNSASNVKVDPDSYLKFLDEGIKWVKQKANKGEIGYKLIDNTLKKTQEWFAPFFKTNASLLKKSLQYSPLELAQVINDYSKVKAGRMDLTEMVDHMAKFVTGSELYLLGMLFSRLGWLKWDKDDEDYSGRLAIKVPNTKYGYTIDFVDPVSTIFAKGVVLDQELQEEGVPFEKARKLWEDYETIFLSDELDMFSSLNDFIQTLKKVDKGEDQYGEYTLGDGATDTAFSVLNSYIPAIIRDISRLIDPNKKVVYDSRNWKYLANRLMNSTPFRGKLVDKKDATGNTLTYTQPFTGNETADRVLTMFSKGKLVDMQGKAVSGVKETSSLGKEASQFSQMAQDFQFKDENGDGFSDAHWIRDSVPSNIYPAGEKTELNPEEKDKYGKTWTDTWTSGANYLLNNDEYKKLDYENQADIIYELQGFAREVIEADYCKEHDMEMTTAQQKASAIKDFVTKNGKVNGELLGLIALGNAKENKMANGGQRYVMAEQDENGKTIKNSRQLMMRQIYEENGVYEEILKVIENSNGLLEYADFGLGKTVVGYSEEKAKKSYAEIYGEVMNKAKTGKASKGKASKGKTKKTTYKGKTGGRTSLKTSSLPKSNAKLGSLNTTKIANNYFKAYANVFNRSGSKNTSGGGTQSTCPNCGARVSANASRCPNCGAKL